MLIPFSSFQQVVTKTFNGAGLVVPVDKNGVGYREIPETNGKILGFLFLAMLDRKVVFCFQ